MTGLRTERDYAQPLKPEAWPFYVVCDVSSSMWHEEFHPGNDYTPWNIMSDGLGALLDEIDRSPSAHDICHLSVIAFGERVETVLPLTQFHDDKVVFGHLPKLVFTDYAQVFHHLAQTVENDYYRLSHTHILKRPTIYFLTDGRPQTDAGDQADQQWRPYLDALHALPSMPIMVSLGFGNAPEDALRAIASEPGPACVADDSAQPSDLLRAIINSIIKSVKRSAETQQFVFDLPAGMRRL